MKFSNLLIVVLCLLGRFASAGLMDSSAPTANESVKVLCVDNTSHTAPLDTNENTLATCTVPANAMGPNGCLEIESLWQYTNSANNKSPRVRYSGVAGGVVSGGTMTTSASFRYSILVCNRASTNSQVYFNPGVTSGWGITGNAVGTLSVNTTVATTVVFSCQKATGAESCVLEDLKVKLIQPGISVTSQVAGSRVLCYGNTAVTAPADTNENTLATCTVPAGAMGTNGTLRIHSTWTITNGADDKILRVRFSGASGTIYQSITATTTLTWNLQVLIANRNATNSQVSGQNSTSGLGGATDAAVTSAVDTTVDTTVVITCQKETAGNTCTLERYLVELLTP